jgi:hypothetical protein
MLLCIGLASVVASITIINSFITPTATNGTEKYSGAKLKAAQHALDNSKEGLIELHSFVPYPRESVVAVTKSSYTCHDSLDTVGANDPGYYDVTINSFWLFGLGETNTVTRCQSYP